VGRIFLRTGSWIFLPFGIAIALLVGFSRVYSRARFPHQIVLGWVLGFVGSRRAPKRDSFYFLQRTLEARANGLSSARAESNNTPRSQELSA
jgi:membrane-associated phospholipid phosphatase